MMRAPRRSVLVRAPLVRAYRTAVVLLALAVLGTGLLVPSAQASPRADACDCPPAGANTPRPEVGGEFADIARKLLADPIGRAGLRAHKLLSMTDGNRNLAVIWFDLTGFQLTHLNAIIGEFGQGTKYLDGYIGYGRLLKPEGNESLFNRIGISGNGPVLEFVAVNDPGFDHSEIVIYDRSLTHILSKLGMRDGAIKRLLKKAVAGFSDRGRCPACLRRTSGIPKEKFVSGTPYETKQDQSASANRVNGITSKGITILKAEEEQQKAKANRSLPAAGSTGATCAQSRGKGGRGPVLALTARLADGCGEAGKGAGGLAQALEAPADADAYGGVDFSTLEMRYVSDGSGGVRYAYSAKPLPDEYQQDAALGMRVVQNLGADLRTWLALDPQAFWVNLNPTEPDRVIDPALGRTNAGRALLEADLEMKRTEARILHPDTATGARYWRELKPAADGSRCFDSRAWIVPGQVEVREDGDSLYILKALLDVRTESENIEDPYAQGCDADPATDAHNENLERTLVLPEIVKAVNTAPEYAPLRRAFMARIIAEWVRERHQQGHRTSFDDVIESADLGPAELDDGWRPKEVFDAYVDSYRNKEFDITRKTRDGTVTRVERYTVGGADLTHVTLTTVGAAEMAKRYPQLAASASDSVDRQVTAADGSIWLGSSTNPPARGFWDGFTDKVDGLKEGPGVISVVILVALGGLVFGFRNRQRPRGPAS
ncbi:hypothetical protein AB0H18_42310 [Streptomyces sp. NPDC020766]|uniref:hypothetical protein n=1 Tax=Streptomyces sp. NPDC020766 TaxID=3155011 RepID=UPI00340FB37A